MRNVIYVFKPLRELYLLSNEDISNNNKGKTIILDKYSGSVNIALFNKYKNPKIFNAHEIIMYDILLHWATFNKPKEGYYFLTFKDINKLRGLKYYNSSKNISTERSYANTIECLAQTYVRCSDEGTSAYQLITYDILHKNVVNNKQIGIKFKINSFGELLFTSKNMTTISGFNIFQYNFKEIISYQIARYLIFIIFINKQKCAEKSITIKKILENIVFFNRKGINSGQNYYEHMMINDKKTQLLKRFNEKLLQVLNELKSEGVILDYRIGDVRINYLDDDKCIVFLRFKEKNLTSNVKKKNFIGNSKMKTR